MSLNMRLGVPHWLSNYLGVTSLLKIFATRIVVYIKIKQGFPNIDMGSPFHQTPTRKCSPAPSPSHPNPGCLAVEILYFPLSFTLKNSTEEEKLSESQTRSQGLPPTSELLGGEQKTG